MALAMLVISTALLGWSWPGFKLARYMLRVFGRKSMQRASCQLSSQEQSQQKQIQRHEGGRTSWMRLELQRIRLISLRDLYLKIFTKYSPPLTSQTQLLRIPGRTTLTRYFYTFILRMHSFYLLNSLNSSQGSSSFQVSVLLDYRATEPILLEGWSRRYCSRERVDWAFFKMIRSASRWDL